MDCITALVGVSGTNAAFDIAYSYIVPPELEGEVSVGKRVIVPFGRGNRRNPAAGCTGGRGGYLTGGPP